MTWPQYKYPKIVLRILKCYANGLKMTKNIDTRKLDILVSSWCDLQHLDWNCLFTLPHWLRAWWLEFGEGIEPHIISVYKEGDIVGVAPLLIQHQKACFIGSPDVCDYLDFVISSDNAAYFFSRLMDELIEEEVNCLELHCLRPDSTVLQELIPVVKNRGNNYEIVREATSLEIVLPETWEAYLDTLTSKQRHETRRKLRRLSEAGRVDYRVLTELNHIEEHLDHFMELFRISREDKAGFMTSQMENFFRRMARDMSAAGFLRLGILELDGKDVAMLLYSDYEGATYLYNSAYDPVYSSLGVGLVSKLYCLRNSIEEGQRTFDFMKGSEIYKYRLGGKEIPISCCTIQLR